MVDRRTLPRSDEWRRKLSLAAKKRGVPWHATRAAAISNRKWPWDEYPREVAAFIAMQKRVQSGYTTTEWPRTREGFFVFLEYVGRIPRKMKWPSLGRKNHSKGYHPGNCMWQEFIENGQDASTRYYAKRCADPVLAEEYGAKISRALKGRVFSEEHRRNISIAARRRKKK